jgi:site-specific DNA recombinase
VVWHLIKRLKEPDAAEMFARAEEGGPDLAAAQEALKESREAMDALAAEFGAGEIDMQEWRIARASLRARKAEAEAVLSTAVRVNPVAELLNAEDMAAAWEGWDLSRKRAAIDWTMTVSVLPAKVGRQPGGSYWDPDAVRIEWKRS